MEIKFKDIEDADGYRVSSEGNIWSCWKRTFEIIGNKFFPIVVKSNEWKKLKLTTHKKSGRLTITINGKTRKVAVLVLEAFKGKKPQSKLVARHLDGNVKNNNDWNLCWGTQKQNCLDKIAHGTIVCGEKVHSCKTKEKDIISIRKIYSEGKLTQRQIGKIFNLSESHVSRIVNNKKWQHIG